MKAFHRPRLGVERLESRECPALTTKLFPTALIISGTPNSDLIIERNGAPSVFTIMDGTKTLGTYNLNRNLIINLAARPGRVEINLDGGVIGGNVIMNLGNGFVGKATTPSEIDVYGADADLNPTGGTIRGSLTILKGNGQENVNVGAAVQNVPLPMTDILPITIRGNLTAVGRNRANKIDFFQVGEGSNIRGGVNVVNYEDVTIGLQDVVMTAQTLVGGNVSITTAGTGQGLFANFFGVAAKNVFYNAAASTSFSNTFTMAPIDPGIDSIVRGNVFVRMGTALVNNQVNILGGAGVETSIIQGNLSVTSVSGNGSLADVVVLGGEVNGSAFINLGGGENEFSFEDGAVINGDLYYTAGNGDNFFGTGGFANVFLGILDGNLVVNLGNGDNEFSIQTEIGATFYYRAGNGDNDISILPTLPALYNVSFLVGSGTNSLTLNPDVTLSGILNGTTGNNTLNQNGATLLPTLIQINWP